VKEREAIEFLQWALPRLRLRWPGYRRVRGQVCKRLDRRLRALGLANAAGYRAYLDAHPAEWDALDRLCCISISRFFRDRAFFEALEHEVLPALSGQAARRGDRAIECWCAGCASGEEPYGLAILWRLDLATQHPGVELRILGTDLDTALLERAARGCYRPSSLKELPPAMRAAAFEASGTELCLRQDFRQAVRFACRDVRKEMPEGVFDLVLCRNLALTYFEPELQREVLARILERLRPGGALAIGSHERLPGPMPRLAPWPGARGTFRVGTAP
jgi:chemotaxis protein methyltransferase CheR